VEGGRAGVSLQEPFLVSKYYYMSLTDDELEERKKLEERRSVRAIRPQDRAIAAKNVEAIIAEQARRFEEKHGLK